MISWDASYKKIPHRRVDVWRELTVQSPFTVSLSDPDLSIAASLEENPPDLADNVLDRPDRDALWIGEIAIAAAKYLHVLRLTRSRAQSGAVTWSSTDAHHLTLLAIRAWLATLGIAVCSVKPRTYLVDFRPELGPPQIRKKFKKNHSLAKEPVRIFAPQKKQLEQKELFALFNRALRTVDFDLTQEDRVNWLKAANIGSHSPARNSLLYRTDFWIWHDDLLSDFIPIEISKHATNEIDELADFELAARTGEMVLETLSQIVATFDLGVEILDPIEVSGTNSHPLSFIPINN